MNKRILDPYGRPASNRRFFEGLKTAPEGGHSFTRADVDTNKLLDRATWRDLMSAGRSLFANVPILRGAILEQANFSLPLRLHYSGQDREWGKIAEEFVFQRQESANIKGPSYNSAVVQRLRLIGRKVDGDIGTLFIDAGNGLVQTQLIRAHRIGDREKFGEILNRGPFAGRRVCNGVVLDKAGRVLGYQILGENADQDFWVYAKDLMLSYRPEYADYYRGISELTIGIRSFADIKRLRNFEMRAQQIFSSRVLIEHNDTGYADEAENAFGGTPDETPEGIQTETLEDGLTTYYRARSGGNLTAFRSDRPSANAQEWEKEFIRQAFYGIEWDPDFALCLQQPGGAWVRAKMQKIVRAVQNNVAIEANAQEMEAGLHCAKAIEYGLLPMPKDGNWHSWTAYLSQPLPTVDSGNERAAQINAYNLGLRTKQEMIASLGGWIDDVNKQRKREAASLAMDARELNAQFPEVGVKEWMIWLEQRQNSVGVSAANTTESQGAERYERESDDEENREQKGGDE